MVGWRTVRRRLFAPAAAAVAVALAACSSIGGVTGQAPPDFPGCEGSTDFAFIGESTLAELGLDDFGHVDFGEEANKRGMIWVTNDRVDMAGPAPLPPGIDRELTRVVCVEWPDGSGMAGPIDDDWQPPGAFDPGAGESGTDGLPIPLLTLLAGVAVLGGVSFVAFRQPRAKPDRPAQPDASVR